MKKTALLGVLLLSLSMTMVAQQQPPSQPPPMTPPPSQPPPQAPRPAPQGTPPLSIRNSRLADLIRARSPIDNDPNADVDPLMLRQMLIQKYAQPLYRKPSNKELVKISPNPSLFSSYGDFLRRPNTGVFRLVVDRKCDADTTVVNASEECLEYTMPGAGNSYSFRTESYRLRRLSDISYSADQLESPGVLMHGILTDLGDVSLQDLALTSAGLPYLTRFQPTTEAGAALEADEKLRKGIWNDGHLYARAVKMQLNHTYALRSIAYRGKLMRAVKGAAYNELDFDKRRDVIIAFRVVASEPDGSITIVWIELQNLESPRLRIGRDEKSSKNNYQKLWAH